MSRFSEPQDPTFQALNNSIAFDWRLAPYDIQQSLAHARMLGRQGIISGDDVTALEKGLEAVKQEVDAERFEIHPEDEDVHMAIERRLTEIAGPVGGKLHTARSRNDQVATDVAMFVRAHTLTTCDQVTDLMRVIVDLADRHIDWPMPGYTHLQRAQPVYLGHHLMAHFWRLSRDHQRFQFCLQSTARLPLGAGALAGVNFDTDRDWVARELGFEGVVENSMDAVSNRDFVLDFVSAAATCATHLSQLGAEIVLWSSDEFGFCEVADAFASGSSIMPQKKNPDAAELLRAKSPRVVGRLVTLHGALHGLPLTYNKDLQEDKEALFDATDTLALSLSAAAGMLGAIHFRRERLESAASDEMLAATDVADLLVKQGVPFREAHGIVAGLVKHAVDSDRTLSELTDEELAELAPAIRDPQDFRKVLSSGEWLESKRSHGGTSLDQVRAQISRARSLVA
jgi:argininosuccinate lyase